MGINNLFDTERSPIMFLLFGLVLIAVSGIAFGMIYYVMDTTETAFQNTHCEIHNNAFFDTCQDAWSLAIYPFFVLKDVLVYFSLFLIMILVLGMLLVGYNSGTKPYMLGVLLLIQIAFTYGSIWLANIYRQLLENEVIRNSLIHFGVYNKIMLNFPWFVFVISLFSLSIGIVNWQRIRRNTKEGDLDY